MRGEEPVFVVTGRKEDVGAAKREIMSAAEHFSQIRYEFESWDKLGGGGGLSRKLSKTNQPGQVRLLAISWGGVGRWG